MLLSHADLACLIWCFFTHYSILIRFIKKVLYLLLLKQNWICILTDYIIIIIIGDTTHLIKHWHPIGAPQHTFIHTLHSAIFKTRFAHVMKHIANQSEFGAQTIFSHVDYNSELCLTFTVTIAVRMLCLPCPICLHFYCKATFCKEYREIDIVQHLTQFTIFILTESFP